MGYKVAVVGATGNVGREILAILLAEAEDDPAFAARIEQSYERIVALKSRIR